VRIRWVADSTTSIASVDTQNRPVVDT
jgi:hypothetical protein